MDQHILTLCHCVRLLRNTVQLLLQSYLLCTQTASNTKHTRLINIEIVFFIFNSLNDSHFDVKFLISFKRKFNELNLLWFMSICIEYYEILGSWIEFFGTVIDNVR